MKRGSMKRGSLREVDVDMPARFSPDLSGFLRLFVACSPIWNGASLRLDTLKDGAL